MAKNTSLALITPAIDFANDLPRETQEEQFNRLRAEMFASFAATGTAMGNAQLSKFDALREFNRACLTGLASVDEQGKAGDDADRAYMAIATAYNAAIADRKTALGVSIAEPMPIDPKVAKASISIFRALGKKAVRNQREGWIDRVLLIHGHMVAENTTKYSAYMAVYHASTGCAKDQTRTIGKKAVFTPTDADLKRYLAAKPKTDKTASEALDALIQTMTMVSQDHDFSRDVLDCMRMLRDSAADFISAETKALRG
jgi:hypothetical protein